ncbi:imine reductase family protein [Nocardia sp. NPDC003345]
MRTPVEESVIVLGRGVRAAALAEALAINNAVTVWDEHDENHSRPILRGDSLPAALDGAALVIICVEDYDAAARAFQRYEEHIGSRDLVNLTSGTSMQAQQLASWVGDRGGRYLDGALMAHPEHVGNPETVVVYSGSEELFVRHEPLLGQLGGTTFLGPNPGTAALYDIAMLNFAWATLIGYLYSAALLRTAEIGATKTAPLLNHWLSTTVVSVIADYAQQIDDGRYPGDEEWLELDAPLMDHLIQAADERGIKPELPHLIRSLTLRGIEAGHGSDSFASLIEIIAPGSHAEQ